MNTIETQNAPEILNELDLPEGFTPCCAVTLGKTDDTYKVREISMERITVNMVK